jgi:hypothetical protein
MKSPERTPSPATQHCRIGQLHAESVVTIVISNDNVDINMMKMLTGIQEMSKGWYKMAYTRIKNFTSSFYTHRMSQWERQEPNF